MKNSVLSMTVVLLLAQPVFATGAIESPPCPSLDAIKSVGLADIVPSTEGYWKGVTTNIQYDKSNAMWTFTLTVRGKHQNKNEATNQAKMDLSELNRLAGNYEADGQWYCHYFGAGYSVYALTVAPVVPR